jgi:hypothetical protein
MRHWLPAALLAYCAFMSGDALAEAPCKSEAMGCYTFEMFAVVNDPNNPTLSAIASGQKQPSEDDAARRIHRAALSGQMPFYQGTLDVQVFIWKSSRRGVDRIQVYDNPNGGWRRAHAPKHAPNARPPRTPTLGPPDYVFSMTAVGKDMMIAFPDEFFTPETQILLCAPTLPSIAPDSRRQEGLWFTDGTLPWHRQVGKALSTFFLVDNARTE